MKNHMKSFLAVAVLIATFAVVAFAQTGQTLTIQNKTTQFVGDVTINQVSTPAAHIMVPGQGSFTAPLTSAATSIIINGHLVGVGTSAKVVLASGSTVNVNWTGGIVVVDTGENN
jgi:hypothetical protein